MADLRPYPVPVNDVARGRVIDALGLTGGSQEPFFAHVVAMARALFDAPVAFISLIRDDCQTFLRIDGVELESTPRSMSLCAYTVAKRQTVVIPDTHLDERSEAYPNVVNAPHVRFSASAPVILSTGFCLGTVCAVDFVPHAEPAPKSVEMLEHLAAMVARFYEVPIEPDPQHVRTLQAIAEEAQEEFLSLVSHELRTPLNGIQGLAQVIDGGGPEDAELVEALRLSADHLEQIVENILSFTELRSGELEVQEGTVCLDELLQQTVATFGRVAGLKKKTLRIADAAPLPGIRGDAAKLGLALDCLAMNFAMHGGATGTFTTAIRPDGGVTIELRDDGEGIDEARLATIWTAFGVGASVHRRTGDGIGLGLPLSSRLAEIHGGDLDLVSGSGETVARLRLPAWRSLAA